MCTADKSNPFEILDINDQLKNNQNSCESHGVCEQLTYRVHEATVHVGIEQVGHGQYSAVP